jgi:hypothetical protein
MQTREATDLATLGYRTKQWQTCIAAKRFIVLLYILYTQKSAKNG